MKHFAFAVMTPGTTEDSGASRGMAQEAPQMTLKDVGELSPPGTASQSRREVAASSWARGRKWKCRGQELRQVPGITRHWVAPSMGNRSPHPTSTPGRRGSWGTVSQAQAAGDHTAQPPCLALPPNWLQSPDPTLLPPWASVSPSGDRNGSHLA